jgi:hypothetical protein
MERLNRTKSKSFLPERPARLGKARQRRLYCTAVSGSARIAHRIAAMILVFRRRDDAA